MAEGVKSLFQRLTERRAMIEAGNASGRAPASQKPAEEPAAAPDRIAELEAELAALKARRQNINVRQ
jgi:hypothetical protein